MSDTNNSPKVRLLPYLTTLSLQYLIRDLDYPDIGS